MHRITPHRVCSLEDGTSRECSEFDQCQHQVAESVHESPGYADPVENIAQQLGILDQFAGLLLVPFRGLLNPHHGANTYRPSPDLSIEDYRS